MCSDRVRANKETVLQDGEREEAETHPLAGISQNAAVTQAVAAVVMQQGRQRVEVALILQVVVTLRLFQDPEVANTLTGSHCGDTQTHTHTFSPFF